MRLFYCRQFELRQQNIFKAFDKQAVKAYCIKMLRKKDKVLMTKSDIKNVYQLLNYLLDENAR